MNSSIAIRKIKRKTTTLKRLFDFYQFILAVMTIVIFFTYMDVYLYSAGSGVTPKLLILVLIALSAPLSLSFLLKVENLRFCTLPLLWSIVYLLISWVSTIHHTKLEVAVQELETRILSMMFFWTTIVIFFNNILAQSGARIAILIASFVNVINNFNELLHPLMFSALNLTGRPAGLYIDPNTSGCALILGLIFSITLLPKSYRIPFVLTIGFGILLTFSRGSILSWLLVNFIFLLAGIIPKKDFSIWGIGLIVGILVLIVVGTSFIDLEQLENAGILNKNIMGRIIWFQDPSAAEADADTSRLDIVKLAYSKIASEPFWGNGIAHTQIWGDIRPHNMYLFFAVEHGILAVIMLPALIFSVIKGAKGENSIIGLNFGIFISFWSIFSHNVLEQRFLLCLFALMNAMTIHSQMEAINRKDRAFITPYSQ